MDSSQITIVGQFWYYCELSKDQNTAQSYSLVLKEDDYDNIDSVIETDFDIITYDKSGRNFLVFECIDKDRNIYKLPTVVPREF